MKINTALPLAEIYCSGISAEKKDGKSFEDFLAIAGKSSAEKKERRAEETESAETFEPHPCYRCDRREECTLMKDGKKPEQNPFAAEISGRGRTDYYQRYFILSKAVGSVKEDRSIADYLNFFYNNICPFEREED